MLGRTLLAILASASIVLAQLPTKDVNCGGNKYTPAYITSSIDAGIKYLNNGNLQGMLQNPLEAPIKADSSSPHG